MAAKGYFNFWILGYFPGFNRLYLENSYMGLMVIGQCFRSLKGAQVKMTPMNHWLPNRVDAHVRICVLALLIQRVAELSCQMPWGRIRNILQQLQVT